MKEKLVRSLFPLRGSNPVLYTAKAADVIIDLTTGKEYIRDKSVLFYKKDGIPKTIEESEPSRWKFVLFSQQGTSTNYLKEIWVDRTLRG